MGVVSTYERTRVCYTSLQIGMRECGGQGGNLPGGGDVPGVKGENSERQEILLEGQVR